MAPLYYKDAHAAIVVYAIDNEESFNQVDYWLTQLDDHGNQPKMVKIIVGNKSDLDTRKVSVQEGKSFADQKRMQFFETSALLNDGSINDLFSSLAAAIKRTYQESELTA